MTGSNSSPPGGSKDEPPGDNRTPIWMRRPDEIDTVVLLLRRRNKNAETEKKDNSKPEAPLSNPFIVGTTIELQVGAKEARTVKAVREARGSRYLLRSNSRTIVEKLKKITHLTDGTEVEIITHPTLNTVDGIVYDPDSVDVEEKDIGEYLSPQGVRSVRRIKKRVNGSLKNTPLLVLSFSGTCLPKYVYFGVLQIPVRTYYPSPMICFNCGAYGHSRKSCQHCGICLQCSKSHTVIEGQECKNPQYCFHCKEGHAVTSRECPKYKTEEKIIRIKVDQGVSFPEARRIFGEENRRSTIANVVREHLNQELAEKNLLIETLQKQVAALTKELSTLKKLIKATPRDQSPSTSRTRSSSSQQNRSTTSSAKPVSPQKTSNTRLSRKDKTFISPPTNWKDNQKTGNDVQTRSKSGKRHMEISPTDHNKNSGKRAPNQKEIDDGVSDMDE